MRFETGNALLHDHAHSQEGAEDIGIVVQQLLLHLNGNLGACGRIECAAELNGQLLQPVAVVAAGVLDGGVQTVGIKEVGGVAQTGVDIGADPDVPLGGILADGVVILRTVDLDLDADLLERSLRGLGQQRQLLTGRVGQPADGQLLSVLLADAVAVRIDPAGLLQNGLGLRGIIGDRIDALAEGKAVGEGAGRGSR